MKICLVGKTYPIKGGISHYSTLLCQALRKKHDVLFIALKRQFPDLVFSLVCPGKSQRDFSKKIFSVANEAILDPVNPLTWLKAGRRIRELAPDITVFQYWHPFFALCFGTMAFYLKYVAKLKTCFICHTIVVHADRKENIIDIVFNKYAFCSVDRYLVHSRTQLKDLRKKKPRFSYQLIPHPTYEAFKFKKSISKGAAQKRLGLKNEKVILFFGLVRSHKGLKYLLNAMSRALKHVECTLLIVGEFYESKWKYLNQIRKLGLSKNVVIVDRYVPNEDIQLYFSAADVVVTPYTSADQSGIARLAFDFNKPVIASNIGSLAEAVDDGKTGILVAPADPEALAVSIIRFYEKNMEKGLVKNIRQQKGKCTWEKTVAAIEALAKISNAVNDSSV